VNAFKLHEPLRHTAYNTLRRYLRVRQNPPAYAAMGRDISFACHCKSVIGFGSPLRYRRMAPPYAVSFCGCVLYGGHAWGSFMSAGFPYRPVYQPAHGRHLRLVAKVMAPV